MPITYQKTHADVDWHRVADILKAAGMSHHAPATHKKAFEANYLAVYAYAEDQLIGFGRIISDGQYQAAIYDCAVMPEFQGRGIGSEIVTRLSTRLTHCNIILYASPGREGFYQRQGFARMKTGMALFLDMKSKRSGGFID